MYYTNRTCNVMPHSESYGVKTDKTGQTEIGSARFRGPENLS
jgi:hypothetical protein